MIKINIKELKSKLQSSKRIIVIPHKNPDGDAIGSCIAINELLKSLGHKSSIISPNNFPDFLKWMDDKNEIKIYENDPELNNKEILNSDLIFTLDFNSLSRIGLMGDSVNESNAIKIMIDHHQKPDEYAKYIYSDVNMSSTCEMVYHFITELSLNNKITPKIASALYTGIMTDTGTFKFPLTTDVTHSVVSELIKKGANGNRINNLVYDNNSYEKVLLLSHTLSSMVVDMNYKTAYMYLTQESLNKFNFKKGDTEGFVNYGLSIKGVNFSAIFIENDVDKIIKISFRSKGNFDVNNFSRCNFNGGGHINAAGGFSKESLNDTILKFKNLLPKYKTKLIG
ncbi:bifunctional oligoribonuclease/PAP phosphatase NrnA [Flavobacteriaceae bacterium]|nr:bifunctional oligoribonuclease/PAP phosphatase NrnA [Flavobacteriaceae bacterium]